MQLKVRECITLKNAIEQVLAGSPKTVRQNNADGVIFEPPKLDADTFFFLGDNAARLEEIVGRHVAASRAARKAALLSAPVEPADSLGKPTADLRTARELLDINFQEAEDKFLDATETLKLHRIGLPLLKLSENPAIAKWLPALRPILKKQNLPAADADEE